jgi:hypothetical protein
MTATAKMTVESIQSADNTVAGEYCDCWKCGGSGRIDRYASIANGVCFACKGSGRHKAGEASTAENGVHTFQVGELVWQFEAIHHYDRDGREGGAHLRISPKTPAGIDRRVDSVMFQVWKNGQQRRQGVTILRARVSPEVGRKVWAAARAGMRPEDMTAEFLEVKEQSCSISRNQRGISTF